MSWAHFDTLQGRSCESVEVTEPGSLVECVQEYNGLGCCLVGVPLCACYLDWKTVESRGKRGYVDPNDVTTIHEVFMFGCLDGNTGRTLIPAGQSNEAVSTEGSKAVPWHVLVVDDDEWTRQMLRDILEAYPDVKVVGEAGDGREAVSMATVHRPDLVIMDIALPYVNGIEATQRIKKALPQTVIIGISGNYMPQVYNAMRTAGAVCFMCKDQVLTLHDTILHALGMWTDEEGARS